jgi:hypothetical protein
MKPIKLRLLVAAFVAAIAWISMAAQSLPTGEVQVGQSILEPTYDDLTGVISYVLTPIHPAVHPNSQNQAPFYLPVYPQFHCSVVPAAVYSQGLPLPPAPALP